MDKGYIHRNQEPEILESLKHFPAVAILGPRQSGKSTLVKKLIQSREDTLFLDLEDPADRLKLSDPGLFFSLNAHKLICLDEIQRTPELFPVMRSVIDRNDSNGQFLILGSASRDLIRQSSESLAGRIAYIELPSFRINELRTNSLQDYWLKGGFPRSFLAADEQVSFKWRQSFISTFLERDIAQLGFNYPPETMRRLWKMCAGMQAQLVNLSQTGSSLGISHTSVRSYLDLLSATYMVRLLMPVTVNVKKRLIRTPKIFIRDTGILHALLNISGQEDLFSHHLMGASWETMVIENLIDHYKDDEAGFYRTANGTELDLVISIGKKRIGIECKASTVPKPGKGVYIAMNDLQLDETWIVAPVKDAYPITGKVIVKPLQDALMGI